MDRMVVMLRNCLPKDALEIFSENGGHGKTKQINGIDAFRQLIVAPEWSSSLIILTEENGNGHQTKGKRPFGLSKREIEILQALSEGLTNKELAKHFFISIHTVKSHLAHIFRKMDVQDRTSAIAIAFRSGIVR